MKINFQKYKTEYFADFSKAANELTKQYPSPIGILTGPIFSALIHKREDFETILKHPSVFDKTPLYGGLGAIANEGLLTTNKGSCSFSMIKKY